MIFSLEFGSIQLFVSLVYLLYICAMTVLLVFDEKPVHSTIAWLLTLIFLPFVGMVIYLLAGVNWKRHKILKQRPEEVFYQRLKDMIKRQKDFLKEPLAFFDNLPPEHHSDIKKTIQLLLSSNKTTVTLNNTCQPYHAGIDFFNALKTDLTQAQKYIHMEFFIWKSDSLGWEIAEILAERAKAGIEVRLILDGVGCFWKISRKYKQFLKKAGIEYRIFLDPLNPFVSIFTNYLNHRKIVVIDGFVSFIGGMNLAEEYITGGKRFETWRDSGLRFQGEVSQQLQTIFATDWFNSSGTLLDDQAYFPNLPNPTPPPLPVQLACSGPDSDWASIRQLYFSLIMNADQEVYLQSPYFIPDTSILTALEAAAMAGVEIHLMLTGVPDKKIPFWVAETYFKDILRAGVRVYRYQKGFLHCKTIAVDEQIASIGTCNLDIRSFVLDYEVNAVVYHPELAHSVKAQFQKDAQNCIEVTLTDLEKTGMLFKLRNNLLKILSPLL